MSLLRRTYRKMLLSWIVFGVLCFTDVANGQKKEASACYGTSGCSHMSLSCSKNGSIFILRMLYGRKLSNSSCSQNPPCGACCQPEPSDCLNNYSNYHLSVVYRNHNCWNSTSCSSPVQQENTACPGHDPLSTYAVADYSCLGSEDITAFHQNTTTTAPAVAVHYDSDDATSYPVGGGANQTWHCQVDTADCVQRQADVMLVKESYETSSASICSSVRWSGGSWFLCGSDFLYASFNTSTPFHVSVKVEKANRHPSGWAVVRAQDSSSLTVRCGFKSEPSSTASPCPGSTTLNKPAMLTSATSSAMTSLSTMGGDHQPDSTPPVTSSSHPPSSSSSTSNQGRSSSLTSVGSITLTKPAMLTSATSSAMTSLSTMGGDHQPDSTPPGVTENSTGAVVGGVVAAVLVLVAAVVGVFCFLRRRRHSYNDDIKPPGARKTSMQVPLTLATSGHRASDAGIQGFAGDQPGAVSNIDRDYAILEEVPGLQNSHVAASSIHENERRPSQDPDYDFLGEKKTQSSKPAALYGRLGKVGAEGEDTEYSYDHLARGRKPAPDVIDSDYDTAALHMTSEGDYNVVNFHKGKQRVITGSAYDVAEIVTSDDAEYYNAASEPSVHVRVEAKSDVA